MARVSEIVSGGDWQRRYLVEDTHAPLRAEGIPICGTVHCGHVVASLKPHRLGEEAWIVEVGYRPKEEEPSRWPWLSFLWWLTSVMVSTAAVLFTRWYFG